MRRFAFGLIVFCLAFETGALAQELLFGRGLAYVIPTEKAQVRWEEDIREAVFRFQIRHYTPVETAVYYLSHSQDIDPSDELIQSLKSSGLPVRRLSQLGTYPITNSGCYYCSYGETEFVLRVGSVRWLNDNEVIVGGSLRRWHGNVDRAFLFHVVRRGTSWLVKSQELI